MRGLPAIILNPPPVDSEFTRGLIVLSCGERHALRVHADLAERYPRVQWTLLYRYDPGKLFSGTDLILSSDYASLGSKFTLLKHLRSQRFDVVGVAWTGEPSFAQLKILALLSAYRYLLVATDADESFFLVRSGFSSCVRHVAVRWTRRGNFAYRMARALSWLVLAPVGVLLVVARVCWLSALRFRYRR